MELPQDTTVKVSIVSDVAHTKGAKRELLLQLRQQGDIDQRTLLEELGLDADEIGRRLNEEAQGVAPSEKGVASEDLLQQGPDQVPEDTGSVEEVPTGQDVDFQEITPDILLAELETQGIELGPEFIEDPALLEAVIAGRVKADVVDGVFVIIE